MSVRAEPYAGANTQKGRQPVRPLAILLLVATACAHSLHAAPQSRAPQGARSDRRLVRVAPTDQKQVNIRQRPSTESAVVAVVRPGEEFEFSEVRDGWYRIPSKKGWLAGRYAIVISAARPAAPAARRPTAPRAPRTADLPRVAAEGRPVEAPAAAPAVRRPTAPPTPDRVDAPRAASEDRKADTPAAAPPQTYDALVNTVAALLQDGRDVDALAGALELMRRDASRYESHLYLGITRFRQNAVDEAERLLTTALRLAPDDRKARVQASLDFVTKNARFAQLMTSAEAASKQGLLARAAQSYTDAWKLGVGRDDIGLRAAKLWMQIGEHAVAANALYTLRSTVKEPALAAEVDAALDNAKPVFEKTYQEKDCSRKAQRSTLSQQDQIVLVDCASLAPENTEAARAMARHFAGVNDYGGTEAWLRAAGATGKLRRNDVLRDPSGNFAPLLVDDRFIALIRDVFGNAAVDEALAIRAEYVRETAALKSAAPGDRLVAAQSLKVRSPHLMPEPALHAIRAAEVGPTFERTRAVFAETKWKKQDYDVTLTVLAGSTCAATRLKKESIERESRNIGTPDEGHWEDTDVMTITLDLRSVAPRELKSVQSLNSRSIWLLGAVEATSTSTRSAVFPRSRAKAERTPKIERRTYEIQPTKYPQRSPFIEIDDIPRPALDKLSQQFWWLIFACSQSEDVLKW